MHTLSAFIQQLDYVYVITYSGLSDERLATSVPPKQLTYAYNEVPISAEGVLHPSTEVVFRFEAGDLKLSRILDLLSVPCTEPEYMRCPPIFRDSLVFYGPDHQIRGILHFCFSCIAIEDAARNRYDTNSRIMAALESELRIINLFSRSN